MKSLRRSLFSSANRRVWIVLLASLGLFRVTSAQTLIAPTSLTVTVPTGSNNPANPGSSNPYTDDVILDSLTFGSTTLTASGGQIAAIQSAYVVSGRGNTNAEWGDNDTNSDSNPDPFARVGINVFNPDGTVNTGTQESTDPAIQDIGLASVFSSLSLSEITDGEGGGSVTNFIFSFGVKDSDNAVDSMPEIVLFERGNNDTTTIRAITGGTYDNPVFGSSSVTINSGDMWNTGIYIDTTEINEVQQLAATGIDLNSFGITSGTTVYGIQIETTGGDFGGFFQAAEDPGTQFVETVPTDLLNPLGTIPEPSSATALVFFGFGSSMLALLRRNRGASRQPGSLG